MSDAQVNSLALLFLRSGFLLGAFWLAWEALKRQPRAQVALCRSVGVALLVLCLLNCLPVRPHVSLPLASISDTLVPAFPLAAPDIFTSVSPTTSRQSSVSHAEQYFLPRSWNWGPLIWIVGTLFLFLRWRMAFVASQRRLRQAAPAPPSVRRIADLLSESLDVYPRVNVLISYESKTPSLLGPRPVILLPHDMAEDEAEVTCGLAHELVHVKANDWWWAQGLSFVQALFWPMPLVWFLRRAHDRAAEMVCDSLAAPLAGGADVYAGTLARQGLRALGRAPIAALPMARSVTLRERLERLLSGLPLPAFSHRQSAFVWGAIIFSSLFLAEVNFRANPIGDISTSSSTASPSPAPASTAFTVAAPGSSDAEVAGIYKQARDAYAALTSYSDTGTMSSQMGTFSQEGTFTTRLKRPGFYRVSWILGMNSGVVWSDGTGDYLRSLGLNNEKQKDQETALSGATGISGGAASEIPASFFRLRFGNVLNGTGECRRLADDAVDGISCTVVASTIRPAGKALTTTLWIGQQDHLIHKFEQVASGSLPIPPMSDDSIKSILKNENKPATPETIAVLRTQLKTAQEAATKMLAHGITFIQVHHNIQTNPDLSSVDFRPDK